MRFLAVVGGACLKGSGWNCSVLVRNICTITRTRFGLLPAGGKGLNPQKFLCLAIDFGESNSGITQATVFYALIWSITRNWWGGILARQAAL